MKNKAWAMGDAKEQSLYEHGGEGGGGGGGGVCIGGGGVLQSINSTVNGICSARKSLTGPSLAPDQL